MLRTQPAPSFHGHVCAVRGMPHDLCPAPAQTDFSRASLLRVRCEWSRRWASLAIFVPAPAGCGPVGAHAAGMKPTTADGGERARRWIRLVMFVVAPAGRSVIPVVAPAGHGPVGAHPAAVILAGADGCERSHRRIPLTPLVPIPAGHSTVGAHSATVVPAGTDRGERTCGRIRLTIRVPAPAGHGAVGAHATAVKSPGTDRHEPDHGRFAEGTGRPYRRDCGITRGCRRQVVRQLGRTYRELLRDRNARFPDPRALW